MANLIIIPLTTFAFEYLLIMFPLMFAIPPLSFLSKIFDVVLSISIKFGNYIAKLGLFFATSGISVILPILSFVLMFIISDYFFETRKNKIILSSFLIFTAIIVYSLSILLV